MKPYLMLWQFARVVAVVVVALVVALALIHSRRSEETLVLPPLAHGKADVPVSELARCRSVAPGDVEVLESCRRIWAEIRQHFFASSTSSQQTAGVASHAMTFSGKRVDYVAPNAAEQVGGR
jgi:conjugative transfer region protein TrbK